MATQKHEITGKTLNNAKNKILKTKRLLNTAVSGGPVFTFSFPEGAARTPCPTSVTSLVLISTRNS